MSWAEIENARGAKASSSDLITASSNGGGGRFAQWFQISFRAALGVDWIAKDKRVKVEIGSGEHEGKLRLTPGGAMRIQGSTGGCVALRLPRLAKQSPTAQISTPLTFEIAGGGA